VTEIEGRFRATGRIALVVSRYNEMITTRLLAGARAACAAAGAAPDAVDVLWVPGAFELGVVAMTAARSGRYSCIVALGAVIRGETPHFDFVAGEASRALAAAALETGRPVGFGLLTTDDLDQALARAGGSAGNKGYEAAEAAIRAADLLHQSAGRS
jgi:6,7-dimethyl-8-ribityllumazine synthase